MTQLAASAPEPNGEAKADRQRKYLGLSVQNIAIVSGAFFTGCGMYYSLRDSVQAIDVKVEGQNTVIVPVVTTVTQHTIDLQKQADAIKAVQGEADDLKQSQGQVLNQLNKISNDVSVLLDRSDPKRAQR
jgi:hypothetical protein